MRMQRKETSEQFVLLLGLRKSAVIGERKILILKACLPKSNGQL